MNREIKFRAWDEQSGSMVQWEDICKPEPFVMHCYFSDSTKVLLQFTGFRDRDGKEIYEGDILAVRFHPHYVERISWQGEPDAIASVFWDHCCFRLSAKGDEDERYADFNDLNTYGLRDVSLKHSEVLGNIYENPELLGKEAE